MSTSYILMGIAVMSVMTYLIRMIPMAVFRKKITNVRIKSFLYYVPYVTLSVMTFPAILDATGSIYSAWAAQIIGIILAWRGKSLFQVALFSCMIVFVLELFIC